MRVIPRLCIWMSWLCPLHSFTHSHSFHLTLSLFFAFFSTSSLSYTFGLVQFSIWFFIIIPSFYCLRVTRARARTPILCFLQQCALTIASQLYFAFICIRCWIRLNFMYEMSQSPSCPLHCAVHAPCAFSLSLLLPSSVSHRFARHRTLGTVYSSGNDERNEWQKKLS